MNNRDCGFLFLTESCNLYCAHCYVSALPGVGVHMDPEIVRLSLNVFKILGINDIRLTGGEPTIHPNFKNIVDCAIGNGFRLGLITNGIMFLRPNWGKTILAQLSRCWVSVYGLTANSHGLMVGTRFNQFDKILSVVGERTSEGYCIGISASIQPGEVNFLPGFLEHAFRAGVKKLRFIPVEPDGRMEINAHFNWHMWPNEIKSAYKIILEHPIASEFEILTINNPFDFESHFKPAQNSCLLRRRQMWSIVPSGDIYPCCFNVYKKQLCVANVIDADVCTKLKKYEVSVGNFVCRGLNKSFWHDAYPDRVTCPISSVGRKKQPM